MKKTVFDFQDYKKYLREVIEKNSARGFQARMAEAVSVQSSFLSRVLQKDTHLTPEQAIKLNGFLGHSSEEAQFFILLNLYARAGSIELREHFRVQMKQKIAQRLTVKNRVSTDRQLSMEEQSRYYSAWYYAAIRVALGVPELQSKESLAQKFALPASTVSEVLEFLIACGMVEKKGNKYVATTHHLHLGNDSALIAQLHTNWRIRAISSFQQEGPRDLHYSNVMTISREDALKVKSLLVNYIEELRKRIAPSQDEIVCTLGLDFFEL